MTTRDNSRRNGSEGSEAVREPDSWISLVSKRLDGMNPYLLEPSMLIEPVMCRPWLRPRRSSR